MIPPILTASRGLSSDLKVHTDLKLLKGNSSVTDVTFRVKMGTKPKIDKALIWITKVDKYTLVRLIEIKINLQYERFWPFGFWERWQNQLRYGCYGNGHAFWTHWTHDENSVSFSFIDKHLWCKFVGKGLRYAKNTFRKTLFFLFMK